MSTIGYNHFRLLAIFVTVVEAGSFAAAARQLRSSRSRVSEQISQLELDLGVRLLQRSTRQLSITTEGQQVYDQAKILPEMLHSIESITAPETPSGRVSITLNHDIAHKYLLPVIPEFEARFPDVKLDLILEDKRVNLISENIDLAIRIGIPKDESLIARVMHEERFGLFASTQFLEKYGTPKNLDDLQKLCWVLIMIQNNESNIQHLRQFDRTVTLKPETFYRCNSPLMAQKMVLKGLGVGALLPTTVSQDVSCGRLKHIMPTIHSEPLVFSLVYPSRRQIPLRTRVVIDYLLNVNVFN